MSAAGAPGGGGDGAWSLRLRGPRGQSAALQVDADATVQRFCELAAEQLGLGAAKDLTFRCGFPPRPLTAAPTALIKDALARNDTIVVGHASSAGKVTAAKPQAGKRAALGRGRAAAAAAKKPADKARGVHSLHTAGAQKAAPARRKITGQGFQLGSTLDNDAVGVNGQGEEAEEDEEEEAGPGRPRYRRTRAIHLSSKEDVELALADAVSGRSNDRAAKFFRAATRNAVDHQYQVNIATARLNAARGKQFEIQEVRTARRAADIARDSRHAETTEAAEMNVRFKESPRKWREETVTLLQAVELQAIVKYVLLSGGETGREMLKPFNMAQASPRVFWSIARLYGGDIEAGLAELAPDQDWSYLDIRTRELSKKAREAKANEEHYKLWKKRNARGGSPPPSPPAQKKPRASSSDAVKPEVIEIDADEDQGGEASATAAAATTTRRRERATSKPEVKRTPALSTRQSTTNALRSAAAQAALSRLGQSARTSQVVAAFNRRDGDGKQEPRDDDETETEVEDDLEETTTIYCDACGKARMLSLDEAARVDLGDSDAEWTCEKLTLIGRTTGCDALDDEVLQITGAEIATLLASAAGVHTREDLADAHVRSTVRELMDPSDAAASKVEASLSKMVDEARLDEVNDLMLELAGGDAEVVGALELQKLGTPADLLTTPTDLVLQALVSSTPDVTMQMVVEWQQQAEDAVAKRPWLREWRTL